MLATETNKQILIVDRDVAAVDPLRQKLSDAGFSVRVITDGAAAAVSVAERPPHLMIIDWNMPGFTALDLIQGIRSVRSPQAVRLIILSALTGEQNIVAGLNFGADDYIAKPFSLREAVARVSAVLRSRPRDIRPEILNCDELVLDPSSNRVTAGGRQVDLRGIEYRLLEFLMANLGRTFNRTQLLTQVWGDDTEIDERTVDVNVQRLRKILSACGYEAYVQTVRGFGYRFAPPSPVRDELPVPSESLILGGSPVRDESP
ncbi:MAG TPA: winged helix-turn-helix domain-containing protein [Steroidobacteraceae bacterium]|nr:winged helix-turn-helix domain-containing protein [Steroidobacteraceae bacterium]